ncbi:MAG: hypothetical protein QM286_00135 [Acidobacteriota bacterium]|nr:hypothetical protein [Acidobacteriota bacterium]
MALLPPDPEGLQALVDQVVIVAIDIPKEPRSIVTTSAIQLDHQALVIRHVSHVTPSSTSHLTPPRIQPMCPLNVSPVRQLQWAVAAFVNIAQDLPQLTAGRVPRLLPQRFAQSGHGGATAPDGLRNPDRSAVRIYGAQVEYGVFYVEAGRASHRTEPDACPAELPPATQDATLRTGW